jgi:hypothetical protein
MGLPGDRRSASEWQPHLALFEDARFGQCFLDPGSEVIGRFASGVKEALSRSENALALAERIRIAGSGHELVERLIRGHGL